MPTRVPGRNHLNGPARRAMKSKLFGRRVLAPCCYCEVKLTFKLATLEHVVTLAQGGSWKLDNLKVCCLTCNQRRGNTCSYLSFKRRTMAQIRELNARVTAVEVRLNQLEKRSA